MRRIMRNTICFILVISMVIGMTSTSFANMKNMVGDEDNSRFLKLEEEYDKIYIQNNDIMVSAFKNKGKISVTTASTPEISASLVCSEPMKCYLSKDSIALYSTASGNYEMTVQVGQNISDDIELNELKTLMTINNRAAPIKYTFLYELPKGYAMMNIEEYLEGYGNDQEKIEFGDIRNVVVIIDENKNIVYTIDDMNAVDASGNVVDTYYMLEDNKLTQIVKFSDDTKFPVVLHNSTHPDYDKTKYLNKSEVKEVRDRYSGSSISMIASAFVALGVAHINNPAGIAYTIISTVIGGER